MVKLRILFAVLGAALLAACSASEGRSTDDSDASTEPGDVEITEITVGTSPALSNVGLYLANEEGGIFEQNGLHATPEIQTSGATAIPLLLNGQLQFTAADPLGAMLAINNNTPLVIVASGNTAGRDLETDNTGLIVGPDSDISSASDLSGKTLAVNGLNGLAELSARESIEADGGNPDEVSFVEVPIPQMQAAVEAGTVDGAVSAEPFMTAAIQAGFERILPILSAALPGVPQIVYVASEEYVASNPDIVAAFAESIEEANTILADDQDEIRRIAEISTEVTPELLAEVILPEFDPPTVDLDVLEQVQELMVRYGVLAETFDIEPNIFSP